MCVCVCTCIYLWTSKTTRLRFSYVPIISLQVSGLKCDQFPFVNACCNSVAVMAPLLSVSTAMNQEYTVGSTPGGQPWEGGAPAEGIGGEGTN